MGEMTSARPGRPLPDQNAGGAMGEVAIRLHIEPLSRGGYLATSSDVPGLVAEGRTIVEAVEIAQGLARKIVESCLEHGDPVPPALSGSGRSAADLVIPVMVGGWDG